MPPPDKIKLSPESKRTFLEVGLKHIVDKQKVASEEQRKSLLYSFVKLLCVKKFYLYRYYPIDPGFYRFNLRFEQNPDSILVSLASKDYNFYGKNSVSLIYDSAYKLVNLLLPSYIGVTFPDSFTNAPVSDERFLKILELSKGKFGFRLSWFLERQFMQTLLKAFASCIYVLDCFMHQFEAVEFLQFPAFDYLSICSIEKSGQILRILKCKADKLKLCFLSDTLTIEDNDLVDLKNDAVKKLYLDFNDIKYVKIKTLAKQLHKCCPSLKYLEIEAYFFHQDEFPSNQVFDKVVAYVKCMEYLKAYFGNCLVNLYITFRALIRVNERDNTWIKRICDNSEFKRWKFESHEKVSEADDWDEEDDMPMFEHNDILDMRFGDTGCNLEMFVEVITPIENEDQALINADE